MAENKKPKKYRSWTMVASPKSHMASTPMRNVTTMTTPPALGIGTSWEDRRFGMSMILKRLIMKRQITMDIKNRHTAKSRWVKNAYLVILADPGVSCAS